MLTTKEDLIKSIQNGAQPKYLFFWGHHAASDNSITKSCFSQWWESNFVVDGITYRSAEHYMMAAKARLFGDEAMATRILAAVYPKEAKALGREITGFNEATWTKHRSEIVIQGNHHKFSQDSALRRFLVTTGDRVLVEASPNDSIWGIGLAGDHIHATRPEKWPGMNLLGFALMQVRDRVRQEA
jgi:ribA/ribD-fused uncharacterized protein